MEESQFIFQRIDPYFTHKLHAHQVVLLSRHKMEIHGTLFEYPYMDKVETHDDFNLYEERAQQQKVKW